MTDHRSPPPQAQACLLIRYSSSQKGGTLIAEGVVDQEVHEHMLACGGYRPQDCGCCSYESLHIHDYRLRLLLADPTQSVTVVRFWCPGCGATWQVLPAFVARWLWRSWATVEQTVAANDADGGEPNAQSEQPVVAARTRRRWLERLRSAAAVLVAVLASSEQPDLIAVAGKVGHDGSRGELVAQYVAQFAPHRGERLAQVAALLHRLVPGVRLM